jgi:hypothetical protein
LVELLRCWDPLRHAFLETQHPFRIEDEKKILLELRSVIHPIRNIQRMAQKTKELATFQVYVLLMHVYFGTLDEKMKLPIFDPSLTFNQQQTNLEQQERNVLDCLQPTSVTEANALDPRTVQVRKLLRHAMFDRFYKRYHPRLAYKVGRVRVPAKRKDLHFSYLFDIHAVLHPALSDCGLMRRIIMSFPDISTEDKL